MLIASGPGVFEKSLRYCCINTLLVLFMILQAVTMIGSPVRLLWRLPE